MRTEKHQKGYPVIFQTNLGSLLNHVHIPSLSCMCSCVLSVIGNYAILSATSYYRYAEVFLLRMSYLIPYKCKAYPYFYNRFPQCLTLAQYRHSYLIPDTPKAYVFPSYVFNHRKNNFTMPITSFQTHTEK